ncbi:MAG: ABC transporter ATP-binding protein [Bacilli bacterium]|nr:ABC transporter ATP-binding protein [Bacilli bacterium]
MSNKNIKNFKGIFRNIKKSWRFVKKEKKRLFICLFFSLLLCGMSVLAPVFSAKMLLNITDGLFVELLYVALIVMILEILRHISHYSYNMIFGKYLLNITLSLQSEIAKETLKLEVSELDKKSSGVFIDRLNVDTRDIANIFTRLGDAIIDVLTNIGVLLAILVVNKIMFLYFLITLIVLFILQNMKMKKAFEIEKERRKISEKNTGLVGELVRGIRDIKALNATDSFLEATEEKLEYALNKNYEMQKVNFSYSLGINFISSIFNFIFIVLGIILINDMSLTISSFLVIYLYKDRVHGLLRYITYVIELMKQFNLSCDRVFDIIDNDKFKKEEFGSFKKKKINGELEFKNVYFSYDGEKDVLKDISFKVNHHETVSFVGRSGSGKSTILSLLSGLYKLEDERGVILVDDKDIRDYDKDSIRNNIAVVTQNPYIFNMSIRDNLKLVDPNLSEKKMKEVCEIACLNDFINTLPDKYDTLVGEGGLTLSGGQRQRLAIARALLKNTDVILLDEATSALDNETQGEIKKAINNMKGSYTIIIVAHRLSTVIDSDRIILVDKGKIVGEGSHKELMKNNSLYQNLYEKEDI